MRNFALTNSAKVGHSPPPFPLGFLVFGFGVWVTRLARKAHVCCGAVAAPELQTASLQGHTRPVVEGRLADRPFAGMPRFLKPNRTWQREKESKDGGEGHGCGGEKRLLSLSLMFGSFFITPWFGPTGMWPHLI